MMPWSMHASCNAHDSHTINGYSQESDGWQSGEVLSELYIL